MNYTNYFETAVAAQLDESIAVTVCDSKKQIIRTCAMSALELDEALATIDYYKVEMAGSQATIYVYP